MHRVSRPTTGLPSVNVNTARMELLEASASIPTGCPMVAACAFNEFTAPPARRIVPWLADEGLRQEAGARYVSSCPTPSIPPCLTTRTATWLTPGRLDEGMPLSRAATLRPHRRSDDTRLPPSLATEPQRPLTEAREHSSGVGRVAAGPRGAATAGGGSQTPLWRLPPPSTLHARGFAAAPDECRFHARSLARGARPPCRLCLCGSRAGVGVPDQASVFRDRATARPTMTSPHVSSARICGHSTARPTPLRKMPRTITMKYRSGIR